MLDDYMNNLETMLSTIFFVSFKVILVILTFLLILSLIILAIGCLIKSQKIKSKFLITVPSIMLGIIFFLLLPLIYIKIKNLM